MWSLKEGAVGKGVCRKWVGRMYKDMVFGEEKIFRGSKKLSERKPSVGYCLEPYLNCFFLLGVLETLNTDEQLFLFKNIIWDQKIFW